MFDHERLDVYRVGLEFVAWAYGHCRSLEGADRHAPDQLLRASQSIPLNIAEGNGKLPSPDRLKSQRIALGSALECAAILDGLRVCGAMRCEAADEGKRILTRMTRGNGEIKEEAVEYEYECEYDEGRHGEPAGAPNAARPRR